MDAAESSDTPGTPDFAPTPETPVLVIGGGPAGLVAAFECTSLGLTPLVLEAGDRLGGAVGRHIVGDITLDSGAESFATARPAVTDLISDLGAIERVVRPNPDGAWVRYESGQAPLPAASWLGVPSRPFAADVRRVIGLTGALRATIDRLLPARIGSKETTFGGLVRSRMGGRVVRRLVEPVVGGVHSVDPDELEIVSIAPTLPAMLTERGSLAAAARRMRGAAGPSGSAVAGLNGGMNTLISSLGQKIQEAGGRIELNTEVRGLRAATGGWEAEVVSSGVTRIVRAQSIIVAVPLAATQTLLSPLIDVTWPQVSTATTGVLLCTLVVRSARLDLAPRGTGMLVSAQARGVRAKALTHASAKWTWVAEAAGPGRHVLRLSYGRGGDAALPGSVEFPGLALRDASDLLGVPLTAADLDDFALTEWASVLPRTAPGHATLVDGIREAAQDLPGLVLTGGWLAGTGLAAVVADARMQARVISHRAHSEGEPGRR